MLGTLTFRRLEMTQLQNLTAVDALQKLATTGDISVAIIKEIFKGMVYGEIRAVLKEAEEKKEDVELLQDVRQECPETQLAVGPEEDLDQEYENWKTIIDLIKGLLPAPQ